MRKEIWKPLFPVEKEYEISNHGRVRSLPRQGTKGRIMSHWINHAGYEWVALSANMQTVHKPVHFLVAMIFISEAWFPGAEVDHIDGNKRNNHATNLQWLTKSENIKKTYQQGRKPYWEGRFGNVRR